MINRFCFYVLIAYCVTGQLSAQAIDYDYIKQVAQPTKSLVPVLVIGSGVAGLSAGIYTARAHLHTIIMAGGEPGGQLMGSSLVENMPGVAAEPGYKIIRRMEKQAEEAGVHFLDDTVQSIEKASAGGHFIVHTEQDRTIHALSIIIATGAFPNKLDIPGEELYTNYGVFTCAVCDCRQATDKNVVVVGGGDSAVEAVMHLAPYAKKITMLVRGNYLRASVALQEKLKKYDHVAIQYHTKVMEIIGIAAQDGSLDPEDPYMTGVLVQDTLTGAMAPIDAECAFVAIGHTPNSAVVADIVERDAHGYIQLQGRTQLTSCPGIFAAGDVTDPRYKQAGRASGDAAAAGLDAIAYLHAQGFSVAMAQEFVPWYFADVRKTVEEN